jgi:hypothetical protein
MSQLIPSPRRPAGYTATETVGANCESPEPNPNTTHRSEDPEDKYVFTINLPASHNHATSGLPSGVA